ncbi:uncharacterized protein LOC127722476 [Mytilus californianus]|uniref:uncharacterized protein LOC127722476 n=1 Tax=Mytilus californianus TaxID=6549 RepID=UPI00224515B9|nr:uncharacterized protein LOC127722476 [Mytilus californianus]
MGESENEKFLKNLKTLIKRRDIEKIKTLINNPKFEVNVRDVTQDLQTPMMKLCYSEIPDSSLMAIMDLLLERYADLNLQDSSGKTAMMHACLARRTTIADYIISDPTSRLEMFDFDGNSVLSHAVKNIDYIITKRILEHPAGISLLEIYNSNGQKPLHMAIKSGNKKIIKIIEQFEANIPRAKVKEKQIKLGHDPVPSIYSPRTERKLLLKRGPVDSSLALQLETSSKNDDSDHALTLSSVKLNRSKKCANTILSPDLILPSISEKTEKNRTWNMESPLARRKARRNSVSLPDLRDSPLVQSGENTPLMLDLIDGPDGDDDDDDTFINSGRSPRKTTENIQNIRKCISENQLSFPSIINKNTSKNSQVKRTLTESSIYSNSDDALSRTMQRLL